MLVEDEDLAKAYRAVHNIYIRYCSTSETKTVRLPISYECIEKNANEITRLRSIRSMIEQSLASIDSIIAKRSIDFLHLAHSRQRYYLVRRRAEDKNLPPSWEELSTRGELWNRTRGSIEVIKGLRDGHNKIEKDKKSYNDVLYVWQMWGYDPETGFWSIID